MNAPTLAEYTAAHLQLFAQYNDRCRRLTDEQLATRSLCPDWNVRQVITHAIGVETVLAGWPPSVDAAPPFENLAAFEAEMAAASRAEFKARIEEVTADRLAELDRLAPQIVDAPSITPTGVDTYGRFLQVRVFDLWVHIRDIAIPLGETTDDSGFVAEIALQEVDDSVGYIVGKRIALPDGMSIVFRIRGDVTRDIAVAVDGRAARVDSVDDPDVEVTTDVATFVLLAAGRIDPDEQIAAGRISWTGDDEWGRTATHRLAYTR